MKTTSPDIAARFSRLLSLRVLPLVLSLTLFLSSPSLAGVIAVPADYPTIQAAINAATTGDTVVVNPGTYLENIRFNGKNIVLRSTDPLSTPVVAATIIDGNQAGSVVTFAGSETASCVLWGFTVRRGYAEKGPGVCGNGTHATIRHNLIQSNWTLGNSECAGGGIFDCDGLIEYNTVSGNSGDHGGGLYGCGGTIRANTISGNDAFAEGGGLLECHGLIEANIISANTSVWIGGGLSKCNGTIQGNLIVNNRHGGGFIYGGGGLFGCSGVIQNNVIAGNWTETVGGGLYWCNGLIRNNTVFANTAGAFGGGGLASCGGTIRNCIIWGNSGNSPPGTAQLVDYSSTPSYSCIQNWTGGGTGNISDDPQLVDPAHGDFHLSLSSPCIDAGGTVPLTVDFEGTPRPMNATPLPRGDGSDFDIGADELLTSACIALAPGYFHSFVAEGTDAATQTLSVWNAGIVPMAYTLDSIPGWFLATPSFGFSDGPASRTSHAIVFHTAGLPSGNHAGTITITAPDAINSPAIVPVHATVGRVTVTAPLGGETWFRGAVKQVSWESDGPHGEVAVYLRRPGYYRVLAIAPNQEGTNNCLVQLPEDLVGANDYVIGAAWTACPTIIYDESEAITIHPLVDRIVWPMAGATWPRGTTATVIWVCSNLPGPSQMDVQICRAGAYLRTLTRTSCQNGTNSATCLLPEALPLGTDYQIRLSWVEDTSVTFHSENFRVTGTIHVPSDYATIQAAINAATHGDDIVVSSGTYVENINFLGKNILLRSTDPTSPPVVAATIIDGNQAGSVVTFAGTELSSCVLSGFTITRGRAPRGGGILGNSSHATVQYSVISHNDATGGGITSNGGAAYDFDGILRSNQVVDNTAGRDGGALNSCDGLVENNLFARNFSNYGGTICWSNAIIRGNVFRENRAGGGGGIYGNSSVIENNVIYNNTVTDHGGGLARCYGTIRNNTIVGNQARNRGGGAVWSQGTFINCIIWGNSARAGAQVDDCSTFSYCCIQNWTGGGTGNISDDPQLVDPAHGDFHLSLSSPCIDAGGTVSLTVDFEGDPRPLDGTDVLRGDGSDIDIGADEAVVSPIIAYSPAMFHNETIPGTNAETQTLTVWNSASQTLAYIIDTTPSWLVAIPRIGFSDGPSSQNVHLVSYRTASLAAGDHAATITITDPSAMNNPVQIPVHVNIGPATITVTSPTAGATWQAGTWKTVAFTCTHLPAPGQVFVYVWRNGAYVKYLGRAACRNGGNTLSLRMPVDLAPGPGYQIRLFWTQDMAVAGWSGNFTITPPPTVTITWPTPGATWQAGTTQNMSYTCADFPPVGQLCIHLFKGGTNIRYLGRAWFQNGNNVRPLRVPRTDPPGSDYEIRLYWTENSTVWASSGQFTVSPPEVLPIFTVTWPTSTTIWQPSTFGNLTFACTGLSTPGLAHVYIWRGGAYAGYLGRIPCQNGSNIAPVRLPPDLPPGAGYQIRLFWTQNMEATGWSENFTVSAPPFVITWPAAGTTWQAGTSGTLTFTCNDLPSSGEARAYAWRNGECVMYLRRIPWRSGSNTVAMLLPAGLPAGSDYQIRLLWVAESARAGWSRPFTVSAAPTIAVTWPTAGATWMPGAIRNLTFTCTNLPSPQEVYLYIWRGGVYVGYCWRAACHNGSNSVALQLPVNLPAGTDYQIHAFWTANMAIVGRSATFTVTPYPTTTFVITWPTTGSTWQRGTVGNLTFTCTNLPAPSEAYGYFWKNGQYVWSFGRVPCHNGANSVPLRLPASLPPGADYQVRLFWVENMTVSGRSGNFTVM